MAEASVGSVELFPSPNENITGEDDAITDEAEATHSVDKNEVEIKSEQLRKRKYSVKILVIGLTGVGKSSLINAMMGDIVAQSQAGAKACQEKIVCHRGEHDGIKIKIYDTAGFGETGIPEKKILKNIAENTPRKGYDLILIAIKMDNRLDADNAKKMLSSLGRLMDPEMWKRTIVVLTFANFFVFQLNNEYQGVIKKEGIKFEVERKTQEFKEVFKQHTGKDWGLVNEIPFVLAGSMMERQLPTDDDWLVTLWDHSILRCRTEVQPFLKRIRFQRLFVDLRLLIRNIFPITNDRRESTKQHDERLIQNDVEQNIGTNSEEHNGQGVSEQEGQIPLNYTYNGLEQSIGKEEMAVKDLNDEPRDGSPEDSLERMNYDLLSEIDSAVPKKLSD
uniref:AIG1-type G domain-containing protein n=1 Tax=Amphimedon queenslandica TaxID=400682 RepID=A0A1X7V4N0_AMPQE